MLQAWLEFIDTAFHSLWKYVVHIWTGQCEIQRICGDRNRMHSFHMAMKFTHSVKKSKQLVSFSKTIFQYQHIPIQSYTIGIMTVKRLSTENSLLLANIRTCLQHLHMINLTITHLQQLKSTVFSDSNAGHVALLESLWSHLKPHVTRTGGRITSEWGELGFQGKDPATDFRGMGLLGLVQLVYFSENMTGDARDLLLQSQYDHQYFPFAATGINLTALVIEMTLQGRFHYAILREIDKIMLYDNSKNIEEALDPTTLSALLDIISKRYCEMFIKLGLAWLSSNSKDLMAFPKVFKEFKGEMLAAYPIL